MSAAEFQSLKLESIIGFGGETSFMENVLKPHNVGSVPQGLLKHPNGIHRIYSLGSTVVVDDVKKTNAQEFLQGHTNIISCLAVSKCGNWIACLLQTRIL